MEFTLQDRDQPSLAHRDGITTRSHGETALPEARPSSNTKVLALCRYARSGASSRLRTLQYIPGLKQYGLDVTVSSLLDEKYVAALNANQRLSMSAILAAYIRRFGAVIRQSRHDLLWIEKEMFPWLPRYFEASLLRRRSYILDYDDATFHQYDQHRSELIQRALGNKCDGLMARARSVVVGNEYLRRRAVAAGARRVVVLPTVVDLTRYGVCKVVRRQPVTILWMGSRTTAQFLRLVDSELNQVCRQTGARVLVVGSAPEFRLTCRAEYIPWSEATEVEILGACDIGIMPLPVTPFAEGKCGYKLVQYMAAGLPVVASPVGANVQLVNHGVNGFLAGSGQEWLHALRALIEQPELRYSFGLNGRQLVEKTYSMQVTTPVLAAVLLQSASKPGER